MDSEGMDYEEIVGSGSEKIVYPSPLNPKGEVWVTFKRDHASHSGSEQFRQESPKQIESRYFFQKLLHALVPESVPDANRFFPVSPAMVGIERRELDPDHKRINKLSNEIKDGSANFIDEDVENLKEYQRLSDDRMKDPAVLELLKKFRMVGLKHFDRTATNFSLNSEGVAQYLDNMPAWDGYDINFSPFLMKKAIERLGEPTKSEALGYFDKINELFEAELLLKRKEQ